MQQGPDHIVAMSATEFLINSMSLILNRGRSVAVCHATLLQIQMKGLGMVGISEKGDGKFRYFMYQSGIFKITKVG